MECYKKFVLIIIITLFFTLSCTNVSADSDKIREAEQFIKRFEELSHKYEEKITEMYADDANIVRQVEHEDGKTEKVILPTTKYKKFLKYIKFFAKIRGYKNYFKNLEFKPEGEKVRITGKRVNTNGYSAPISYLAGKDQNKEWKIFEEITETKSVFLIKMIF